MAVTVSSENGFRIPNGVRWFSDNQNVVRILQMGSRKPDHQKEVLAILSITPKSQIRITPEWIP